MIENIYDHMAFSCNCGSVHFNLLRSGKIECANCQQIISRWKMTTIVKVEACCSEEKEVEIIIQDHKDKENESFILQNGDIKENIYVYDSKEVIIREREKS